MTCCKLIHTTKLYGKQSCLCKPVWSVCFNSTIEEDDYNRVSLETHITWYHCKNPPPDVNLSDRVLKTLSVRSSWFLFHYLSPGRPPRPECTLAFLHHTPCKWTAGGRCQYLVTLLHPALSPLILPHASEGSKSLLSPTSPHPPPPEPAASWSPLRLGRSGSTQPLNKGQELFIHTYIFSWNE